MYCISINHKTAPISVRERVAFIEEEEKAFERQALREKRVNGLVVLSTCNRLELYFTGEKEAIEWMEEALAHFKQIRIEEVRKHCLLFEKKKAVTHLYRVASGLDSKVLGEDEILGQVKSAYEMACEVGGVSSTLHMIFQGAMSSARKIKQMTGLSRTPVSVGTLVAHEIFQFQKAEASKKKLLIIGLTGKLGTIIIKNIIADKALEIIGTIRQHGKPLKYDLPQLQLVPYQKRYDYIEEADIVVSATTSPHYTLTYEQVMGGIYSTKKRLFIDLAVPSDIDPATSKIEGVTLYHLDHFEELTSKNNELRQERAEEGSLLLDEEVDEMMKRLYIHEHFNEIEELKAFFAKKSLTQSFFLIKDTASSQEFEILFEVMKRIVAKE